MQYLVCIFGLLIIACDHPAPTPLVMTALDQGRGPTLDHSLMDMAEDNGIEDAGLPRDQTLNDLSLQDAGGPEGACTPSPSTLANEQLRTDGCRFLGAGTVYGTAPRGALVSGDRINDAFGTSEHEPQHFLALKDAGADFVVLLARWQNLEPFQGQYDAAYMDRLCTLGLHAQDSGLAVFLTLFTESQDGGLPRWSPVASWSDLWRSGGSELLTAWSRLMTTCERAGLRPAGLAPVSALHGADEETTRRQASDFSEEVWMAAEDRLARSYVSGQVHSMCRSMSGYRLFGRATQSASGSLPHPTVARKASSAVWLRAGGVYPLCSAGHRWVNHRHWTL